MNLKEIIQKIFEPNYIKIYKQIEQAFFNGKRIVLNVTEDEAKVEGKMDRRYIMH